jgi:hypothetical protein
VLVAGAGSLASGLAAFLLANASFARLSPGDGAGAATIAAWAENGGAWGLALIRPQGGGVNRRHSWRMPGLLAPTHATWLRDFPSGRAAN